MKKIISLLFLLTLILRCFGDSPLTSTFFAIAYSDEPLIGKILTERGKDDKYNFDLTSDMLKYLDDVSVSFDKKVALINALGWGDEKNTGVYKKHLMKKYALKESDFDSLLVLEVNELSILPEFAGKMSNEDLVILGYLQIMGNYFEPSRGILAIESAFSNNMESEATAWVYGLLAGQIYLDLDWCQVYMTFEQVRTLAFTKDIFRDGAKNEIMEYISLYQNSCEGYADPNPDAVAVANPDNPEYYIINPVYTKQELQIGDKKGKSVDLELLNSNNAKNQMYNNWIFYNEDINGSVLKIEVRNNGNMESVETNMVFNNLVDEENTSERMHYQVRIPPIKAGKTVSIEMTIPQFWIYNPEAAFEIILDFDGNIQEIDEVNNQKQFFEAG